MAKPIFCVTHPRACSTAFERVFMTRTDDLTCIHEPFGDAFYYGPERLASRYENDEQARQDSGFAASTFKTIFDRFESESAEGKRLFIKDIIHYLFSPLKYAQIAPSLGAKRRGIGTAGEGGGDDTTQAVPFPYGTEAEDGNPTVIPAELLRQFHFTFLIRDPHSSIPSYWRCCIPPQSKITGFDYFDPAEAGYDEVRRMFDFLVAKNFVGPKIAGHEDKQVNGAHATGSGNVEICLVDADDLLDSPEAVIKEYCRSVGLDYDPRMLTWAGEADQKRAKDAFEKWRGFHDDAMDSTSLRPRLHGKKQKSEEEWDAEWKSKYGLEGAQKIREAVDANMADYLYLKQYAMKVPVAAVNGA